MPPKKKKPSPYDGYDFHKAVKMWSSSAGPTFEHLVKEMDPLMKQAELAKQASIQKQYEQAMNQMANAKAYYGTYPENAADSGTWQVTASPNPWAELGWKTTVTPSNTGHPDYLPDPMLGGPTIPDRSALPQIRDFMQGMNKDTALTIVWGAITQGKYVFPVQTPYGYTDVEVRISSAKRQFELYCMGELVAVIGDLGFRVDVIGPSEEEKRLLAASLAWKEQKAETERQLQEILA